MLLSLQLDSLEAVYVLPETLEAWSGYLNLFSDVGRLCWNRGRSCPCSKTEIRSRIVMADDSNRNHCGGHLARRIRPYAIWTYRATRQGRWVELHVPSDRLFESSILASFARYDCRECFLRFYRTNMDRSRSANIQHRIRDPICLVVSSTRQRVFASLPDNIALARQSSIASSHLTGSGCCAHKISVNGQERLVCHLTTSWRPCNGNLVVSNSTERGYYTGCA